jgi:hypothetical protein
VRSISTQKNVLFKGQASVKEGRFRYSFFVPKDIDYQFGKGRISYYADNGRWDGNGAEQQWVIGGTGSTVEDKEGPVLKVYLNDERFINGGLVNASPILIVQLADSSGINHLGKGLGHDLQVMIDQDPAQVYVLNDYYTSAKDNYKQGTVRFQLPAMKEGLHELEIKAWDIANNSGVGALQFNIATDKELKIEQVFNYPNPFTTNTFFWFDHNRPGEELFVDIQIFTVSGRLVKTIRQTIFDTGNRSTEVQWDGKDEFGSKLGRGPYLYILKVKSADGKAAVKTQKLYLL